MEAVITIDARGTRCPRPVLELSRAIEEARAAVVVLLADDPNARVDVPVWCRLKHHELVETVESGDGWRFTVRIA
jgi:tRNA 2-thiouridine synthesizing protein A